MIVSGNYGAEWSSLWPPSLLPLPGLYSCCDINWNLMKPLAAPVIIASKEHHLPQHYNIMTRRWGWYEHNGSAAPADPHCFLRGVNVGLKAFYPYQQSIHQSALYQILLFCGQSPSLRFRGFAQPCSGSGEGWWLRLRSHADTDTKSISVSARRKLPLSLTGSWSLPSVVIGVSSQDPITFCRDPHELFVSKKCWKLSKCYFLMIRHTLIFCLTTLARGPLWPLT